MTETQNHLSEEQLVDHYYGEDAGLSVERHLKACTECAASYARLQRDLREVKPLAPPARSEEYAERVWQSIRSSLPVYEKRKRSWLPSSLWKPMVLVAACALLMVSAFVAGREWQRRQPQSVAVKADPKAPERVVVLVLGDHLDRSERLLVELNHADGQDAAGSLPIQSEARELLAANRLVRQSAKQSGDPALDAALDRLERLLVEVANEPDGLSEEDLNRIRQEMNTGGLLFDVRVLRDRIMQQQPAGAAGSKGVSL
jgi:hypothetical protein